MGSDCISSWSLLIFLLFIWQQPYQIKHFSYKHYLNQLLFPKHYILVIGKVAISWRLPSPFVAIYDHYVILDHAYTDFARVIHFNWTWLNRHFEMFIMYSVCQRLWKAMIYARGSSVHHLDTFDTILIEPRHEKTCLRSFRPGEIQTGLLSWWD